MMSCSSYLLLEDGTIFKGERFGSSSEKIGEVVFNTSMTGYQEMLTDPSYSGQILVPTYHMIGNYGINSTDVESNKIQVSGLIVRSHCEYPSHPLANMTIDEYLLKENIPGISGIDNRIADLFNLFKFSSLRKNKISASLFLKTFIPSKTDCP